MARRYLTQPNSTFTFHFRPSPGAIAANNLQVGSRVLLLLLLLYTVPPSRYCANARGG